MHAAVVEVTNRFKTQATAVFFPEPSRMEKHMRMYTKPGMHMIWCLSPLCSLGCELRRVPEHRTFVSLPEGMLSIL